MQVVLKNFEAKNPLLSQAFYATTLSSREFATDDGLTRPIIFTSTLMASSTGQYLFAVGSGKMDPVQHTRLLIQHAADQNKPFMDVAQDYMHLLTSIGYSSETFRQVISAIAGSSDRAVRDTSVPKVTPAYVHSLIEKHVSQTSDPVLQHLVTDFVCHMLRPLGWIIEDAPFVFRLRRGTLFPSFQALVDSVEAHFTLRVIRALADADLSVIGRTLAKSGSSVSPALIAQHLASAVVQAADTARGSHDSHAVVTSVLNVLGRIWNPLTPAPLEVASRVAGNTHIVQLQSNLGIFLAYQDMTKRANSSSLLVRDVFSDEELINSVIPEFFAALTELSPYKIRMISDVTDYYGKLSSRDHEGYPGHIIVYENWALDSKMEAFTPVAQTQKGKQRFLVPAPNVSAALEAAIRPVQTVLSMTSLVEQRIATYDTLDASSRVPKDGSTVIFGLPSLVEREVNEGIPAGAVELYLEGRETELAEKVAGLDETINERIRAIAFDYYSVLTHLAVAKCPSIGVGPVVGPEGTPDSPEGSVSLVGSLKLVYRLRTTLRKPIGSSAIHLSELMSVEPVEIIAYTDDFSPRESLVSKTLPLTDFKASVHLWPWHEASVALATQAEFKTEIQNKIYTIGISEHELLGLGVRSSNIRYLTPAVTRAISRTWFEWIVESEAYIKDQLKKTRDDLVRAALEGRRVQNAIALANLLMQLSSTGIGERATAVIKQRLASKMYEAGTIDDYATVHVGVQHHRLAIWSGLLTLHALSLLTGEELAELVDIFKTTDALQYIVGLTPH